MGTWDSGIYDSDAALDYTSRLETSSDLIGDLRSAFAYVQDHLHGTTHACVAAEIVASSLEGTRSESGLVVAPTSDDVVAARAALERTEVPEFFRAEDSAAWTATIDVLYVRLGGTLPLVRIPPPPLPPPAENIEDWICENCGGIYGQGFFEGPAFDELTDDWRCACGGTRAHAVRA